MYVVLSPTYFCWPSVSISKKAWSSNFNFRPSAMQNYLRKVTTNSSYNVKKSRTPEHLQLFSSTLWEIPKCFSSKNALIQKVYEPTRRQLSQCSPTSLKSNWRTSKQEEELTSSGGLGHRSQSNVVMWHCIILWWWEALQKTGRKEKK